MQDFGIANVVIIAFFFLSLILRIKSASVPSKKKNSIDPNSSEKVIFAKSATTTPKPQKFDGINHRSAAYARRYAAKDIAGIDEPTRVKLRRVIAHGIGEGLGRKTLRWAQSI